MLYKTIVLELLQQCPEIHERLRCRRMLQPALERHAQELKTSHEVWKDRLSQAKPGSNPSQIASEALEMALRELEGRLTSGLPPHDSEPLSLDAAMAFVRARTPPA